MPTSVLLDDDLYASLPTIVVSAGQQPSQPPRHGGDVTGSGGSACGAQVAAGPAMMPIAADAVLPSPDPKVPTALSILSAGNVVSWHHNGAPRPPDGSALHHHVGRAASVESGGPGANGADSATKFAARARGKVPRSPMFCPRKSTAAMMLPSMRLGTTAAAATAQTQVIDLTLVDSDDDSDDAIEVREILRTSRARAASSTSVQRRDGGAVNGTSPQEPHLSLVTQMLFSSSDRLERDALTQAMAAAAMASSSLAATGAVAAPLVSSAMGGAGYSSARALSAKVPSSSLGPHEATAATALATSPATPKLKPLGSLTRSPQENQHGEVKTAAPPTYLTAAVELADGRPRDASVDPVPLSTAVSPDRAPQSLLSSNAIVELAPTVSADVVADAPVPAPVPTIAVETNRRARSPERGAGAVMGRKPPQPSKPPAVSSVLAAVSGLARTVALGDDDDGGDGFAVPLAKRAVDVALRGLFPEKFSFKCFTRDAARVVTPEHVLAPGEFWGAFANGATFVGEGAFGFVWRCTTLDGRKVAVKSSPISFDCPEAIDDGYSVLREIAVLAFLNKHKVRNVLPMHAAFLCLGNEALTPAAAEELARQDKQAKERAKAADDESSRDDDDADTVSTVSSDDGFGSGDDGDRKRDAARDKKKAKKKPQAGKKGKQAAKKKQTAKTAARRKQGKTVAEPPSEPVPQDPPVKLPTFHAITREQLSLCRATVFMVTQLCDGDLDSIDASTDANIARGVALSVSATLNDMHRLGLVHLDLKPGNILFRRVRVVGDPASIGLSASGAAASTSFSEPGSTNASPRVTMPSPSSTTYFFGAASFHGRASLSPTETHFGPPPPPGAAAAAAAKPASTSSSTHVMVSDCAMLSPGGTAYFTSGPSAAVTKSAPTAAGHGHTTIALQFYLSDFGNAQVVGPAYHDDVECIGTYEYMDHAALAKKRCDRTTDCYSLGMTLYKLLTRKLLHTCKRKHSVTLPHSPSCFAASAKGKPPVLRGRLGAVVTALLNPDKTLRMTAAGCYAALTAPAPVPAADLAASASVLPSVASPRQVDAHRNDHRDVATTEVKGRGRKAVAAALRRTAETEAAPVAAPPTTTATAAAGPVGTAPRRTTATGAAKHAEGAAVRRHGHSPYYVAS